MKKLLSCLLFSLCLSCSATDYWLGIGVTNSWFTYLITDHNVPLPNNSYTIIPYNPDHWQHIYVSTTNCPTSATTNRPWMHIDLIGYAQGGSFTINWTEWGMPNGYEWVDIAVLSPPSVCCISAVLQSGIHCLPEPIVSTNSYSTNQGSDYSDYFLDTSVLAGTPNSGHYGVIAPRAFTCGADYLHVQIIQDDVDVPDFSNFSSYTGAWEIVTSCLDGKLNTGMNPAHTTYFRARFEDGQGNSESDWSAVTEYDGFTP